MTKPHMPQGPLAAVVIPLRQLEDGPTPLVRRRPGRPRRLECAPTIDERAYHQAVGRAADIAIRADELVRAETDAPLDIIQRAMDGVAREAASLAWERRRAQREGRPEAERISGRRVNALGRLADLVAAREQLRREGGTIRPEHIETIIGMLVGAVRETVREVAPAETASAFMAALTARMSAASFPACCTASGPPGRDRAPGTARGTT